MSDHTKKGSQQAMKVPVMMVRVRKALRSRLSLILRRLLADTAIMLRAGLASSAICSMASILSHVVSVAGLTTHRSRCSSSNLSLLALPSFIVMTSATQVYVSVCLVTSDDVTHG